MRDSGSLATRQDEHLLIGDLDRQEADRRLQRAVRDGFLTLLEYDERSRTVWGARTRGQLAEAVADLPEQASPARRRRAPAPRVLRRAAAAALVALVAAGGVAVVGVVFDGGEPVPADGSTGLQQVYEVPPGERRLDLDRLRDEVTIVVPDGTRVDLRAVARRGDVVCLLACAPEDEPVLRLSGSYVDELEVLTRTEALLE